MTGVAVTRATAYPAAGTETASYNNPKEITAAQGQPFNWDAENRVVDISYPKQPGKATAFTYDGLGRRVRRFEIAGLLLVMACAVVVVSVS